MISYSMMIEKFYDDWVLTEFVLDIFKHNDILKPNI